MGWTSYHMSNVTRKAIKEECDSLWNGEIIKSVMIGSTYYGALKTPEKNVVGVIVLTRIDNSDYYNFARKEMDEFSGPYYSKCPESILKLLSPTTHEWATAWRERCHTYHNRKKELQKSPLGTTVKVDDTEYTKTLFNGKNTWLNWEKRVYIPETRIAEIGFSEV